MSHCHVPSATSPGGGRPREEGELGAQWVGGGEAGLDLSSAPLLPFTLCGKRLPGYIPPLPREAVLAASPPHGTASPLTGEESGLGLTQPPGTDQGLKFTRKCTRLPQALMLIGLVEVAQGTGHSGKVCLGQADRREERRTASGSGRARPGRGLPLLGEPSPQSVIQGKILEMLRRETRKGFP